MASVGYGLYTYGKSNYGTPVYHFGAATIQASSGFTAESHTHTVRILQYLVVEVPTVWMQQD